MRRPPVDTNRVRTAIEIAERGTSAEIVVSFAPFFFGDTAATARRAFVRLGVASTRGRNGILVFVVPRRRQVVVLPDEEAERRLPAGVADEVVRRVVGGFVRRDPTGGIVEAVAHLADALARVFPRSSDDVNELSDEPAILPESPAG